MGCPWSTESWIDVVGLVLTATSAQSGRPKIDAEPKPHMQSGTHIVWHFHRSQDHQVFGLPSGMNISNYCGLPLSSEFKGSTNTERRTPKAPNGDRLRATDLPRRDICSLSPIISLLWPCTHALNPSLKKTPFINTSCFSKTRL